MQTKQCAKCKQIKNIEYFYWRTDSNNYRNICIQCGKKYQKNYRLKNHVKISKNFKNWYRNNHEKVLETNKQWRKNNVDKVKEYNKSERHLEISSKWRKNNPDKIKIAKIKYRSNPVNKDKEKIQRKSWYENNKDKVLEYAKKYVYKNKELIKDYRKKYYLKNKVKVKLEVKKWGKNNPEKVKEANKRYILKYPEKIKEWRKINKERLNNYRKQRRKDKPNIRLSDYISSSIRASLKKGKNGNHWESLVSYSLQDLMLHLEGLFQKGMMWDNYGKLGWEIDHILPISLWKFDSYDDIEFKQCWSLANLQPLWAVDNLKKGNKVI